MTKSSEANVALGESTLLSIDGASVRLATLWEHRPVVLVFLRHFGCMFCRELAATLRSEEPLIQAEGAELVFIGNGDARMARAFREDYDVSSPLFTDPSLQVYERAGMKYGMGSLWTTMKNAGRALASGHLQGMTKGTALQQGGVLVVDRGGDLLYSFASESAGELPPIAEILGALRSRERAAIAS